MNINLTPEQEQIVKDKLRSGHFRTAEDVIAEALVALRERESSPVAGNENGEYSNAVCEMLSFVDKNRVRLEGISVKQLIHEGHRL
jgi:Arc/MetJ-type ribon-helix-helix transcriptional regulator